MEGAPTNVIGNIKLLNRDNYEYWSIRAKTYLLAKDLWDVVESTAEPPKQEDGDAEYKAWRKKDAEALYAIQSSCGDDAFSFILTVTRAKDAWDILLEEFKPDDQETTPDERSLHDVYPQLVIAPSDAGQEDDHSDAEQEDDHSDAGQGDDQVKMEEGRVEGAGHESNGSGTDNSRIINETLVKFVESRQWGAAMEYLKDHPEAVSARNSSGYTALHLALLFKKVDVAKELVQLMTAEDLEIKDKDDAHGCGDTALNIAITEGNTDIVKCMLEKNNKLISVSVQPSISQYPLAFSELFATEYKEEMAKLLYSFTPYEDIKVVHAADLVSWSLKSKRFDIAWDLIQRYPNVAITKNIYGRTPLAELASISSAFLSGTRLKFWEQWIYNGIHIKPTPTIHDDDIQEKVQNSGREDQSNQRHLMCSAIWFWNAAVRLFRRLVVTNLLKPLGLKRIYKIKLIHLRIHEFLSVMCKATQGKDLQQLQGLKAALLLAVQRGHWEYIMHLCKSNFEIQMMTNHNGRSLYQFAVECRQEKVYTLLYDSNLYINPKFEVIRRDKEGNAMLHLVGSISPLAHIDHIRGAALQMQREMQWLKEVERMTLLNEPTILEVLNRDQMAPHEVFTKNHKELLRKGEASMKETSTSCTVVGALIVTMMFAAAFTVPGGNNGDTGLPIFINKKVFKIFIVSDAISLFSSTTSVMIFLGILTSRYAEDDFLVSLPRKMILGLLTLFFSIATMMIAFSSALYIMLQGNISIIVPLILLSCVPITSFIWLQFPFLVEICISTYGVGIFTQNKT